MVNRYQLKGSLGRGVISQVSRAYALEKKRDVAIKRLLPHNESRLRDAEFASLQREALALSRLKHPNVVELYELCEDENGSYAVLEMIQGESLETLIREGALTASDFMLVASQSLSALAAAEEIQLLHRDLKPSNLMLTRNDTGGLEVKILDCGVSKFLSQPSLQTVDLNGAIVGSVDYVAPEQLEHQPLDSRTDLYSLGCMFYYCLTQRPPFHGESPAQTMRNHLSKERPSLSRLRPDLPPSLCDWVLCLLSRRPDDRPGGAKEALRQFHALASEELTEEKSASKSAHHFLPLAVVDG